MLWDIEDLGRNSIEGISDWETMGIQFSGIDHEMNSRGEIVWGDEKICLGRWKYVWGDENTYGETSAVKTPCPMEVHGTMIK